MKKGKMTSAALRKSCIWPDSFAAYEQFVARLLHSGEFVDIFSGGNTKLSVLFSGIPEPDLVCAFMDGLLECVK